MRRAPVELDKSDEPVFCEDVVGPEDVASSRLAELKSAEAINLHLPWKLWKLVLHTLLFGRPASNFKLLGT